jgi:hypothetical protein
MKLSRYLVSEQDRSSKGESLTRSEGGRSIRPISQNAQPQSI